MYSSGLDSFASGSFWGKGSSLFGAASPIDDILSKDSFSLEEILDEDTAIQETKGMNERLVDFLKRPETLDRLMSYMACADQDAFRALNASGDAPAAATSPEPSEAEGASHAATNTPGQLIPNSAAEQASAHAAEAAKAASLVVDDEDEAARAELEELEVERSAKFPFVACEIICCNLTPIIEQLVNSPHLLGKFFAILDQPEPLDARVSGYYFKVLSVLLRRAPEKLLWFSLYRNVDISHAGAAGGFEQVGWLMPLLLRHIDSYSIMCCFKSLLQVAADEGGLSDVEEEDDETNSFSGYGAASRAANELSGDLDGRPAPGAEDEERNSLLRTVRSVWLGGSGAALAVLNALAASNNSDSHNNAAELLADMIQRAAVTRMRLQAASFELSAAGADAAVAGRDGAGDSIAADSAPGATGTPPIAPDAAADDLPVFSGLVLQSRGRGANAETAMIESGCEWTLTLCEELLTVALFESQPQRAAHAAGQEIDEDSCRIVERGSAAIASLQVLTHLVSAFALERWSAPGPALAHSHGLAHVTSMEKHGELPPELRAILVRLPDLVDCLGGDMHADLFRLSPSRASRFLGIHRLKIVELTCMLVHTKYPEAIETIANCESNPLGVCLDLFFAFEWNNCLHSVVERTLQFAFLGGVSEASMGFDSGSVGSGRGGDMGGDDEEDDEGYDDRDDGAGGGRLGAGQGGAGVGYKFSKRVRQRQEEIVREQRTANEALLPLHECLFGRCDLVSRLLAAYEANEACMKETELFWQALDGNDSASPRRENARSCGQKGYMGFCHRIVNTIALLAATQRNERSDGEVAGSQPLEAQEAPAGGAKVSPAARPALAATEGNDRWIDLLQGEIAEVNAMEQCVLGGVRPRAFSSPASEGLDNEMEDFDSDLPSKADRDLMLQNTKAQSSFGDRDGFEDEEDADDADDFHSSDVRGGLTVRLDDGIAFEADFEEFSASGPTATATATTPASIDSGGFGGGGADADAGDEDEFDALAAQSTASSDDGEADALAGALGDNLHIDARPPASPGPAKPSIGGDEDDFFDPFMEAESTEAAFDPFLEEQPAKAAAPVPPIPPPLPPLDPSAQAATSSSLAAAEEDEGWADFDNSA